MTAKKNTALATADAKFTDMEKFAGDNYDVVQIGQDGAKWIQIEEGTIIEGILLGREWMTDKKKPDGRRAFFNIQLLRPVKVEIKSEDGIKEETEAEKGEVASLSDRTKLSILHKWVEDGGVRQVKIQAYKQIPIGEGQTMWTFHIGEKVLKAPPPKYAAPSKHT